MNIHTCVINKNIRGSGDRQSAFRRSSLLLWFCFSNRPPRGQQQGRANRLPSSPTTTMASSGHRSHEGYTSSPPSSDPHDPFGSQQNHQRYYDDGSEEPYTHRDTYASDNSVHNYQDGERYYDQNGYDPYSALSLGAICHSEKSLAHTPLTSSRH